MVQGDRYNDEHNERNEHNGAIGKTKKVMHKYLNEHKLRNTHNN